MFWDFYLPAIVESVVSHGCSRGEESGSIYLADLIAIIEVRGEEILASTLDGGRLWRWALGDQVVSSCVESFGLGTCWRYLDVALLPLHRKPELLLCLFFFPLEARTLKAAYSW
jgi:hypothetical protein